MTTYYEYAKATGDIKIEMEKAMDAIDRAPDSFEAVISFGTEPLQELGKVATDMTRLRSEIGRQVTAVCDILHNLERGLRDMKLETLGEDASKLLKRLAKDKISAKDEKAIASIIAQLPKKRDDLVQFGKVVAITDVDIGEVLDVAEKVGQQRKAATIKLNVHLGAAQEVLRRYNEEYIPEAGKQFDASRDPEDELYLKNVLKRKEDFIYRLVILEGANAASVISAHQLTMLTRTLEEQRTHTQDILHNSLPEWQTLLASVETAAITVNAARSNGSGKPTASDAFSSATKEEKEPPHTGKEPPATKKHPGAPKAPG